MTTLYVGPSSAGSADGSSWANRYGSLTAAEDHPVAAGDIVYVGPGVYRETVTLDVSGSSGSPITYIGDVTGAHTDGIGGVVRVTGSDNDQTGTRSYCLDNAGDRNYRTFRGFQFDLATTTMIHINEGIEWVVEDCAFSGGQVQGIHSYDTAAEATNLVLRRLVFVGAFTDAIHLQGDNNGGDLVENCIILGKHGSNCIFASTGKANVTVKNCLLAFARHGVYVVDDFTIYNCVFYGLNYGIRAAADATNMTEDYNSFFGNDSDRINVSAGANSVAYAPQLDLPILYDGIRFPWAFGNLSQWSQLAAIAGNSEATDDLFGITRPTTSAKKSWGAVQWQGQERETTTTRESSTAAVGLPDAGAVQMFVPVDGGSSITIGVYAYREADYSGTAPQMIIKEPGQANRTTTDSGSASTWNQLSDTFTPQSASDYVVVELRSNNTAMTGSYGAFFDDLEAS